MFHLFRLLPINGNKVVAYAFQGRLYGDNPKFIVEKLHSLYPELDIVWIMDVRYIYSVPEWIRPVQCRMFRWLYEFATAKVWIDNSGIPWYFTKRKSQLFLETWHGGLGIKKIEGDVIGELAEKERVLRCWRIADVFISNSDHLSAIYRRAFYYRGPIWKCGYPKNDILINGNPKYGDLARIQLGIPANNKVILYAPTWRLRFRENKYVDMSVYNIDMHRLKKAITTKFGGEWTVAIRLHQNIKIYAMSEQKIDTEILDATSYPDIQGLLMATDVMISDYSSVIFDAAMRRIPCFTYATDFEQYKKEERGVYYEMEELPFPYATNNDELEQNILSFDEKEYLRRWDAFCVRMGLNETGHAAADIANKIMDFINGKPIEWPNDYQ
jgi:CDP-glycerol glycerophosphotransferase